MRQPAFWDASALVPLCVPQPVTPIVTRLSRSYDVVAWWGTPVEISSALARLVRTRAIDRIELTEANRLAKGLALWWLVVRPSDALRTRAIGFVDRYDLRAADGLQLAAGMEWCGDDPRGRIFLSADKRLREAALLSGFDAPKI
jgi:predicted nucleic acid-binding protein